ncbi:hypothetical protein EBO15_16200 [Actinomadura harenae]|uniref:Copper chaperone PCu(A)C n=1 Tax=Actinomadura harenae TaxID=2483351 RepID=A0A3M2M8M9_9ACTN|nr:hypothetical protein EBO15_16200 [Actinomadura harenae]
MVALAFAGAVAMAPVLSGCGAGEEPQTAAPTQLTEGVNAWVPKTDAAKPQVSIRNMFLLGPEPAKALPAGSSVPLYATLINEVPGRADRLVSVSAPEFGQAKIAANGVALPAAKEKGMGTAVSLLGAATAGHTTPAAGHGTPSGAPTKPVTTKSGKPGTGTTTGTPSTPASGAPSGHPSGTPSEQPSGAPSTSATGTPSGAPSTSATGETTPATGAKGPLVVLTQASKQLLGGESIKVTLQFEQAGSITLSIPVIPQQNEFSTYVAVSPGTPFTPVPTASPSGSGEATTPAGGSSSPGTGPSGSADPTASGEPEGTQTPAA